MPDSDLSKSSAWFFGLAVGLVIGLGAHQGWPKTFPDGTPAAWAISGAFWPYAWIHRKEDAAKNIAVFIAALLFALPWVPLLIVALLVGVVSLIWLIWSAGKPTQ
jgi:ABC-type antimicrobial peptide transport system permease subunit